MHTDIGSQSESEEFAEPSSTVISALMKALMMTLTVTLYINIVLRANEVGAVVSQFIHVKRASDTYDAGVKV